jgi:hypothetical protein
MVALSLRWTTLLVLLGVLACPLARAVDEHELKTAIVFNLLVFVEWPADPATASRDSLVLCVGASSALNASLKALQGRPVRSHRLQVHDVAPGASWSACQAVYVDENGPVPPPTVAKPGALIGTLVISDDLVDTPAWAVIVLRRLGARIGFDVNLELARQSRLQLSSKLLRLARTVKE